MIEDDFLENGFYTNDNENIPNKENNSRVINIDSKLESKKSNDSQRNILNLSSKTPVNQDYLDRNNESSNDIQIIIEDCDEIDNNEKTKETIDENINNKNANLDINKNVYYSNDDKSFEEGEIIRKSSSNHATYEEISTSISIKQKTDKILSKTKNRLIIGGKVTDENTEDSKFTEKKDNNFEKNIEVINLDHYHDNESVSKKSKSLKSRIIKQSIETNKVSSNFQESNNEKQNIFLKENASNMKTNFNDSISHDHNDNQTSKKSDKNIEKNHQLHLNEINHDQIDKNSNNHINEDDDSKAKNDEEVKDIILEATNELLDNMDNKKSLSKKSKSSIDSRVTTSPAQLIKRRKKEIGFPNKQFIPYIEKKMILDFTAIDYFTCFLCESLLHNPYYEIVDERPINYCKDCIDKWIETYGEISPFTLNTELKKSNLQKNINNDYLMNIKIKCYHKECKWTGKVKLYKEHKEKCNYEEISCSNNTEGCGVLVQRKDMNDHLAICEYRLEKCNHCKIEFCLKRMEIHLETCSNVKISCILCNDVFERKDKPIHEEMCPKMLVNCEFFDWGCKELIVREKKAQHNLDFLNLHLIMMDKKKIESEKEKEIRFLEKLDEIEVLKKKLNEYDILFKNIGDIDKKIKDCLLVAKNVVEKEESNIITLPLNEKLNETNSTLKSTNSKLKVLNEFSSIIDFKKSNCKQLNINENNLTIKPLSGFDGLGVIVFLTDEYCCKTVELSLLINSIKSSYIGVGFCDYNRVKNQNKDSENQMNYFYQRTLKNKEHGLFLFCSNGDRYVNGESKNSFYGFKEKDKVHIRLDYLQKKIFFKTDEKEALKVDYSTKKSSNYNNLNMTPCIVFSNIEADQITLLKILKED